MICRDLQRHRGGTLTPLCRRSKTDENKATGCGISFHRSTGWDSANDPYLGGNLRKISEALLELDTDDPHRVFGSPDDLKLLSCMTLFEAAEGSGGVFTRVIEKYYKGRRDRKTVEILGRG